MARDDYYMGSLANLDPTRGAYPGWQEPPDEGAWSRGVAAAADINARPLPLPLPLPGWGGNLAEIGGRMGDIAKAHDPFAVPYAVANFKPEVPGQWSEGDEQRLRDLNEKVGDWAPQTAFGMTFDPFRFGQRGAVTMGAGSKIIQPTERPIGSVAEPILAYHSSPHDFDRFDLSKIGTGEGFQMYGHGIYVAENPAVSGQGGEYWKQFLERFPPAERAAAERLRLHEFNRDNAIAGTKTDIRDWTQELPNIPSQYPSLLEQGQRRAYAEKMLAQRQHELSLLESGKPVGPRTYEVGIHAKPEQFLDWDKPLSGQSQQVRGVAEQFKVPLEKQYSAPGVDPFPISVFGKGLYENIARSHAGSWNDKAAASEILREAGIPGIRYLDQGSRSRADLPMIEAEHSRLMKLLEGGVDEYGRSIGSRRAALQISADNLAKDIANVRNNARTSNYVVFNPQSPISRVQIMRKYGLAGAVPAMGALAAADRYQGVQ